MTNFGLYDFVDEALNKGRRVQLENLNLKGTEKIILSNYKHGYKAYKNVYSTDKDGRDTTIVYTKTLKDFLEELIDWILEENKRINGRLADYKNEIKLSIVPRP